MSDCKFTYQTLRHNIKDGVSYIIVQTLFPLNRQITFACTKYYNRLLGKDANGMKRINHPLQWKKRKRKNIKLKIHPIITSQEK